MDIVNEYQKHCAIYGVPFERILKVNPYDDTTLFCPAGMQQYKDDFKGNRQGTLANVQSCVRLNDMDLIGDGTHHIQFDMIGLFSFREWNVGDAIEFWMEFLGRVGARPDYVDVHPDKRDWKCHYERFDVEVKENIECTWSDGGIGGYCTEFFVGDIEIGNIVNPLGTCIDVGFGLERLDSIVNGTTPPSSYESLVRAIESIKSSGYEPSNIGQGFILKKLMRRLEKMSS